MRIAIVINTSWNIYNFRMGLVQAFLKAGHEVYAIAPPDEYSERLVKAGCKYVPVKLDNKGSNPVKDLFFTANLFTIYKKIQPDAILHYTIKPNIYGTLAASLLGLRIINNVSGLGTVFLRNNITSRLAHLLYRFAFRLPEKVFFQNPDDRTLFIERGFVKKTITDVLPGSGVNLAKFTPMPFSRNKNFTFLLIARLLYDKGIVEYAEAIKIIRKNGIQARFQLLGFKDNSSSGIPERVLSEWVASGLIEYLGTTDNVSCFINNADCIVLPSYREGTPRTLLEAAALAKPLIATNVPGCTEIVEDTYNGYLCEVKNPEHLASQMQKMITLDNRSLQQMGEASRQKVEENFNENVVIDKYMETLGWDQVHA